MTKRRSFQKHQSWYGERGERCHFDQQSQFNSKKGKPRTNSGEQDGMGRQTSTTVEDQHGMTSESPATATSEVSQPSHTQGNNSVLSDPTHTQQIKQLDSPLRSQSKCNTKQLKQSKQISGPERSSNSSSNPDRRYYKPSTDTKTYFVNSQGHLQSREDP